MPISNDDVQELVRGVQHYTMVKTAIAASFARAVEAVSISGVPGDIVECGVWRGGMCMLAARVLTRIGDRSRRIWLFDTYAGMTKPTALDVRGKTLALEKWTEEQLDGCNKWCLAPLEEVQANIRTVDYPYEKFIFIRGDVTQTLFQKPLPDEIAVLRSDTDWYESTKATLEVLFDRVSEGGRIQFDDYHSWEGQRRAVDEFISGRRIPFNGFHVGDSFEIIKYPTSAPMSRTLRTSSSRSQAESDLKEAQGLFSLGKTEDAVARLLLLPEALRTPAYYVLLGQANIRLMRYSEALDAYKALRVKAPSYRSELYFIDALLRLDRLGEAKQAMARLPEVPPEGRRRWACAFFAVARQGMDRNAVETARVARDIAFNFFGGGAADIEQLSPDELKRIATVEAAVGDSFLFLRTAARYIELSPQTEEQWFVKLYGVILAYRRKEQLASQLTPALCRTDSERIVLATLDFIAENYLRAECGARLTSQSNSKPNIARAILDECSVRAEALAPFQAWVSHAASKGIENPIPYIVVHRGRAPYVELTLDAMAALNGGFNVIHVGDQRISANVQFEPLSRWSTRADKFANIYKHRSILEPNYSVFSYQRWFIAEELMQKRGINQAVILDSDILVNASAREIADLFQADFGLTNWTWTCIVRRREALTQLCDFIETIFSDEAQLAYHTEAYSRVTAGGNKSYQDMCAFNSFLNEGPKGTMYNAYVDPRSEMLDQAINHAGKMTAAYPCELARVLQRDKFKEITLANGTFMAQRKADGTPVRMLTLHFQGPTKSFMGRYLTAETPLQSSVKPLDANDIPSKKLPSFALHKYTDHAGNFDYGHYRRVQIEANKRKIDRVFADRSVIHSLARYLGRTVKPLHFGICHGSRRGLEQAWFREVLGIEVIGTEISDTANEFPNTVQWDFHDLNPEWTGRTDFIYSNSWDHTYDPDKCFTVWAQTLRVGGVCLIEHTINHEPGTQSVVDPFGVSSDDLYEFLRSIGGALFEVLEPLLADVARVPGHLKGLKHLVIRRI